MRWLIVTGDDFGLTHGINRGIVEAHRQGILTSTSLMVDRPASEAAVALARSCPGLCLGLHLELEGVSPDTIDAELDRQLARFRTLTRLDPTHVDSHHDAHRDARILPRVLGWTARAAVPLRGYSSVRHCSSFYGRWGEESHLAHIQPEGLLCLIDAELQDGVTEFSCHPGYVEPDCPSSYATEREVELRTLTDSRLRPALRERAIGLIGFRDLPAIARTSPVPERAT